MLEKLDALKSWHVLAITLAISIFFFVIAMVGSFLMGASMADMATNTANGNIRLLAFRTETAFNQSNNYTQAELDRLNMALGNFNSQTLVKQAAYDNQIWQLQDSIRLLNTTNTTSDRLDELTAKMGRMQMMLMNINQSVIYVNGTNSTNITLSYFYQADYANTTCFIPLCRSWGYYCNPEWLCSASQAIPDYAGWNVQACSCAREAGLNV